MKFKSFANISSTASPAVEGGTHLLQLHNLFEPAKELALKIDRQGRCQLDGFFDVVCSSASGTYWPKILVEIVPLD